MCTTLVTVSVNMSRVFVWEVFEGMLVVVLVRCFGYLLDMCVVWKVVCVCVGALTECMCLLFC